MQTTKRIIGLAGPKGVGKSTFATQKLFDEYRAGCTSAEIMSFADPLKQMLAQIVPWKYMDDKESIIPHLGKSARFCLQTLGTEWGRNSISQTIWIDITKQKITEARKSLIIIDDVRFDNEAKMIREMGGEIWRLSRVGVLKSIEHVSESGISDNLINKEVNLDEEKKTTEEKDPTPPSK